MSCQMPMVQQRKSDCKCCAEQPVEVSTGTRHLYLRIRKSRCCELTLTISLVLLSVHAAVHLYRYQFKGKNNNPNPTALPRLSTQPQVRIVTTSKIEIAWEGAHEGDGSVCGFVVELKTPTSTSWTSVGFVPFNEDVADFEYTIERLYAGALYRVGVKILNCSGREGERGPEISQSTRYQEPRVELPSVSKSTALPCQAQNCAECPHNPTEDDHFWRMVIIIAVPVPSVIVLFQLIILIRCFVNRRRGEPEN